MNKFLKAAVLACAVAGLSGVAVSVSSTAYAQNAQCTVKDAGGKTLFYFGNGDTVKFIPAGSAFMRNIPGNHHPQFAGKVASVQLQPNCQALLYGGDGANWGHRVVKASGPVGVPATQIGGIKCECK